MRLCSVILIAFALTGLRKRRALNRLVVPCERKDCVTVRGFLSITRMIVLAGLWYVLAATADFLVANDRGGVLGIKLLIGYFLLMEFIFTNNWLVARNRSHPPSLATFEARDYSGGGDGGDRWRG